MSFPATPVLADPCVRLVPFSPNHLTDDYVAWLNDPEIVRFSEQRHRRHDLAGCRAYAESMWNGANHFWALETAGGRHVGNITAYVNAPNLVADVAIMVGDRSVRGQGVGLAGWTLACDWLLGPGGMRKVTAGTMSVNRPMLGVMHKSGMRIEGVRTAQFLWEGQCVDMVMAARFAEEQA